mgnify:CR=1 FL=1
MSKEQFRQWKPKGLINVKYWIDKSQGKYGYWKTSSQILFKQVDNVLKEFKAIGIQLDNRQLHYQLVGKDLIPNFLEVYKRLCVFLTDARYGGYIDCYINSYFHYGIYTHK